MDNFHFIQVPADQFKNELRAVIQDEVSKILPSLRKNLPFDNPEELVDTKEAAKRLSLSQVSVHTGARKGLYKKYKLNGRTYYKWQEILAALQPVNP